MTETEIKLTGGRITAGVVRVGDTVRRPLQGDRSIVHALLAHLQRQRFEGTPRFLGVDAQHREILSFLPGDVPADLAHFADAQLAAAAALLRRFHDATADFPLVGEGRAEVMCHNDWGPPNAVFRDGLPYGLIDFDTLAPGARLWDLGYSAFSWLDLGNSDYSGAEQVRRLGVFAEGYAWPGVSPAGIVAFALARQTMLAASARAQGKPEMAEWAAAAAGWTSRHVVPLLAAAPPPAGDRPASRTGGGIAALKRLPANAPIAPRAAGRANEKSPAQRTGDQPSKLEPGNAVALER